MKRCLQVFLIAAAAVVFTIPLWAQLTVADIPFDSQPNLLSMPDEIYLGEAVGVATNSKGHIFVYTRTGHMRCDVRRRCRICSGRKVLVETMAAQWAAARLCDL